jgi:putative transposase
MSAIQDLSLPILPEHCYHIFNRGNEKRRIFFEKENYFYFLKRYSDYTVNYFDTYSYCLLDNHFHLLLKPKSADEILTAALKDFEHIDATFYNRYVVAWMKGIGYAGADGGIDLTVLEELLNLLPQHSTPPHITYTHDHPTHMEQLDFKTQLCSYFLSERLRRFMLSYAKSINKQQDRTGSLFQKAFRRKHVYGTESLKKVATYIHHNVIHHNYAHYYEAYQWSSYETIISQKETRLKRDELLSWYAGLEHFISYSEAYKKHKWEQESFYIEVP